MSETPREFASDICTKLLSSNVFTGECLYATAIIEKFIVERDAAIFAAALRMAADAVRSVIPKFQLQETRRPTIAELEAIINEPEPIEPISIQPDGSVIAGEPIWVGWCMEAILALLPSDMAAAEEERENLIAAKAAAQVISWAQFNTNYWMNQDYDSRTALQMGCDDALRKMEQSQKPERA